MVPLNSWGANVSRWVSAAPWMAAYAIRSVEPVGVTVSIAQSTGVGMSAFFSVTVISERDTANPSFTSAAACLRFAGVMRLRVPISSFGPQRPQFESSVTQRAYCSFVTRGWDASREPMPCDHAPAALIAPMTSRVPVPTISLLMIRPLSMHWHFRFCHLGPQRLAAKHQMEQDGRGHDDGAPEEDELQAVGERRAHVGEQYLHEGKAAGRTAERHLELRPHLDEQQRVREIHQRPGRHMVRHRAREVPVVPDQHDRTKCGHTHRARDRPEENRRSGGRAHLA